MEWSPSFQLTTYGPVPVQALLGTQVRLSAHVLDALISILMCLGAIYVQHLSTVTALIEPLGSIICGANT
jgi:hypothetical protein